MRVVAAILGITLLHASVSMGTFLASFRRGLVRFDSGEELTWAEQLLHTTLDVLYFPFMQLALLSPDDWFHGPLGYAPLLFNSLFWSILLVYGWRILYLLFNTVLENKSGR